MSDKYDAITKQFMPDYEAAPVKDSGTRRQFGDMAWRDAATGKGRYDLISPLALRRLAVLLEKGAVKYDARNWEKGMPLSVFFDCAVRHLFKHLEGMRDEDHLAAALWNVQGIMHFEEMIARGLKPAELNDLPSYVTPVELPAEAVVIPPEYTVELRYEIGPEPGSDVPTYVWVPQGHARESIFLAQAVVEDLRQNHGFESLPMRIMDRGALVQLVLPGDPAVAVLG